MWGGQASLLRRDRFWRSSRTEIAAIAGQKILGSRRESNCTVGPMEDVSNVNIGNTMSANAQDATVTAPHLSMIEVVILARATFQNLPRVAARPRPWWQVHRRHLRFPCL